MRRHRTLLAALLAVALALVAAPAPAENDPEFWARLAACESENGRTSANLYQFTPQTWAAAGGSGAPGDASAAEQTSRAQAWAARPDINPASSAGWPTCWRIASAGSGTPARVHEAPARIPPPASSASPPPARRATPSTADGSVTLTG